MDDKILLTPSQAKEVLALNNGMVHTFISGGAMLMGADHSKQSIYEDIDNAKVLEVAGNSAQSMGHGLAILKKDGKTYSDILFVETNMELLKKYDAQSGGDE